MYAYEVPSIPVLLMLSPADEGVEGVRPREHHGLLQLLGGAHALPGLRSRLGGRHRARARGQPRRP